MSADLHNFFQSRTGFWGAVDGQDSIRNNSCYKILQALSEEGRQTIDKQLRDWGINSVAKKIMHGQNALVFHTTTGQMAYLTTERLDESPPAFTLRPTMSEYDVVPGVDLHIFPEVALQSSITDVRDVFIEALKVGYIFMDSKPSNMGRLGDGTPIVIDAGAVWSEEYQRNNPHKNPNHWLAAMFVWRDVLDDMDIDGKLQFLKAVDSKKSPKEVFSAVAAIPDIDKKIDDYLEAMRQSTPSKQYDFAASQKHHLASLGLEVGKFKGKPNQAALANNPNSVYAEVINAGGYTTQVGQLINAAPSSLIKQVGLCGAVRVGLREALQP
jgi:hypothetical protein